MKVMLDECVTRRCSHSVVSWLGALNPAVQAHFQPDYLNCYGTLDCDWAMTLKPPNEWLVITGDSGSKGPRIHAKGPPLHLILPALGITGVFMCGKRMTQISGPDKARILIHEMPRILQAAADVAAGTRFKLKFRNESYVLEEWPIYPTASPLPS